MTRLSTLLVRTVPILVALQSGPLRADTPQGRADARQTAPKQKTKITRSSSSSEPQRHTVDASTLECATIRCGTTSTAGRVVDRGAQRASLHADLQAANELPPTAVACHCLFDSNNARRATIRSLFASKYAAHPAQQK